MINVETRKLKGISAGKKVDVKTTIEIMTDPEVVCLQKEIIDTETGDTVRDDACCVSLELLKKFFNEEVV